MFEVFNNVLPNTVVGSGALYLYLAQKLDVKTRIFL
jgi:hypothetical protein